jgi:uncharacterized phage protein gp47/JayE
MTYGLTADGYTAPRQADYLTLIRDEYDARLTALGYTSLPDYERDTFLGQITEIMAYYLGQLAEANVAVYDARSVSNATGLQLDNLALIVGVTRQEATKGTVSLTLTGTDGTVITQGKIVEGGGADGTARWVISADATISGGTATVSAQAEDAGQIVATAGQITTIVTPVDGWASVTNAAAADPGQARETDSELRARRQRALQGAGGTSTNAILAALLELEDVTGATVVDNPTGTTTTVAGVSVDPYAVAAIVAPNSLTVAQQQLVVQAIYDHLGAGTATSGDQSGTVTKRDGRSHTINFYFAADSAVTVAWTLALQSGYVVADVEDELLELVTDYFLTLAPGDTVYPTPLIALAASIDGIANVTSLLLDGGASPVTHDADEQPTLGTHTVA